VTQTQTPEKRLIQAGRKTRDALQAIRDLVRGERKKDLRNRTFEQLDIAVEKATDGLIEISSVFEEVLRQDTPYVSTAGSGDVEDLRALQSSLAEMKLEREELIENLQEAQQQLQKYADDLQTLYTKEREKRAELAEAYTRLQEADSLKADFLNTINHELSSPLVPIDLSLQIVEKGELDTDQSSNLSNAQLMLTQYKRQLDGIIKYAGLVSKTHVLVPKEFELAPMVEDTLEPLILLARGRRVTITLDVDDEITIIKADSDLLGRALYELVHNGVKFNKQGGYVKVKSYQELNSIVFQIEDDGAGIPDAVMSRFGQDFNQIVEAVRRGVEGLGLGLALANYVASAHNGQLTAQHGEKQGTIVQLRIPHNGAT